MPGHPHPTRMPGATHTTLPRATTSAELADSRPTTVVKHGRLSAPSLGVAPDSSTMGGRSVRNDIGEPVVTAPIPSMPTRFRGDVDGSRYRSSYFDTYPERRATETGSPSPTITR
jgi:hypothetical protein